jgi:hypothetical protein
MSEEDKSFRGLSPAVNDMFANSDRRIKQANLGISKKIGEEGISNTELGRALTYLLANLCSIDAPLSQEESEGIIYAVAQVCEISPLEIRHFITEAQQPGNFIIGSNELTRRIRFGIPLEERLKVFEYLHPVLEIDSKSSGLLEYLQTQLKSTLEIV